MLNNYILLTPTSYYIMALRSLTSSCRDAVTLAICCIRDAFSSSTALVYIYIYIYRFISISIYLSLYIYIYISIQVTIQYHIFITIYYRIV